MLHSCCLSIIFIARGTEEKASSLMYQDQNMLTIPVLSLFNHYSWKKRMKMWHLKGTREGSGTWISTGRWQQQPSVFAAFLPSHSSVTWWR